MGEASLSFTQAVKMAQKDVNPAQSAQLASDQQAQPPQQTRQQQPLLSKFPKKPSHAQKQTEQQ